LRQKVAAMPKRAATCLSKSYARIDMAKSRKEGSTEKQRNNHRRNHQSAAEQTERIGHNAADSSREAAQVGPDLLQRNAETVQSAVRVGLDLAEAAMGGSTNHLGLAGSQVQDAAEQTTRGAATVLHSTTAAVEGVSRMSQEYFAFVHHQIERNVQRMNKLWRCRSPQEVAAVQVEFLRETMEDAMQSGWRMARIWPKEAGSAADESASETKQHAA